MQGVVRQTETERDREGDETYHRGEKCKVSGLIRDHRGAENRRERGAPVQARPAESALGNLGMRTLMTQLPGDVTVKLQCE